MKFIASVYLIFTATAISALPGSSYNSGNSYNNGNVNHHHKSSYGNDRVIVNHHNRGHNRGNKNYNSKSNYGGSYGSGNNFAELSNQRCNEGTIFCDNSTGGFYTCAQASYVYRACGPGTRCRSQGNNNIFCGN